MVNYESFVARHGESAAQALVERMERYEGVRPSIASPLKERWAAVMELAPHAAALRAAA